MPSHPECTCCLTTETFPSTVSQTFRDFPCVHPPALPCSRSALCSLPQALQQEKHVLQRKLEMNELASGQREAELAADLATLRADLERRHNQGRDRRRDESEQLTQLANHNQRLVEQLAEVSMSVNSTIMSWKGFFF